MDIFSKNLIFKTLFENISKLFGFLEKLLNTFYVANVSSFQENFEFLESIDNWQSNA